MTHFNPSSTVSVIAPAEWPHVTFCACVARGIYPESWMGTNVKDLQAVEPG